MSHTNTLKTFTVHSTGREESKLKTIILPGYSTRNKEWAQDTAKELKLGHEIIAHNWEHWKTGGNMSVTREMESIRKELGSDKFNIIGKSVGVRIAIRVITELKDKINKVILCGIASVSDNNKKAYKKALADFPFEKIICFQNTKDPFVPYQDVKIFIQGINPKIKVIEKPGSKHNYPYTGDFQRLLE